MTYHDLTKMAGEKKKRAVEELNNALKGDLGFLVKAEVEKNPGSVAWSYLARWFCETLAENIDEIYEKSGETDKREIADIYMGYEDNRSDLYELLPVEAQLFS